jgi:hypothetical protein
VRLWSFEGNERMVMYGDFGRRRELIQAVALNTQYKDSVFNLQYVKYESYNI